MTQKERLKEIAKSIGAEVVTLKYDFELMSKKVPIPPLMPYIPKSNFKFQLDGEFKKIPKMEITKYAKIFGPVLP